MGTEIKIWYPNYQNNPGILSKVLRLEIEEKYKNFGVSVLEAYFEGNETFCLTLSVKDEAYTPYVTSQIHRNYGKFNDITDLKDGEIHLGRLQSPGKVGFGIFVDIGLRHNRQKQECLLPLYQLRENFHVLNLSARKIVKKFGLVSALPLKVEILPIEDSSKIDLGLTPDTVEFWNTLMMGSDKLLISKTLYSRIDPIIKELGFRSFIDRIEQIDPLTSIIYCKPRTKGEGLIPKIGSRLPHAPIGLIKIKN